MKKISIIIAAVLLFASCDKIPQNEYLLFAGSVGEWFDGNGVSDHSHRAVIEKYTGVRCTNCPSADEAINACLSQYDGKLLAVAIHDSCFAFTLPIDGTDLRTSDGNAWSKYFNVFGHSYPAALVNRQSVGGNWDIFTPTSGINSHVDDIVNSDASIAVAVNAIQDNGKVEINVDLELLQDIPDEMTLTLLLIEDGITATQRLHDGTEDANYTHNHVLRDVITDIWGTDIDCKGTNGEKRSAKFEYTPEQSSWDLTKCHIVAYVSDKTSKAILNVAESHIQ